ncbi:N-terminal acetyltransferase A complex auxiliary subunit NAA15-like [Macadamia integrifolia]|uniref:N-terminal acetyltransferase A complex auxiliary subunit NAA15-like n=1 Tax=Macadamia integrifolia TaxID=60698 RepID=UPI001C4F63F4|nr:N-terminal acetyltransferase A complex auxiliary subunit NAA15-like [Macadamia integrifolia]
MLYVLEPEKNSEAVKIIEDSTNNLMLINGALRPVKEWKLRNCISVHKLLGMVLVDPDAASRWKAQCAEYFPFSTYFEGPCSSAIAKSAEEKISKAPQNGGPDHEVVLQSGRPHSSNGKVEVFKDLTI